MASSAGSIVDMIYSEVLHPMNCTFVSGFSQSVGACRMLFVQSEVDTGRSVHQIPCRAAMNSVEWNPKYNLLAFAADDKNKYQADEGTRSLIGKSHFHEFCTSSLRKVRLMRFDVLIDNASTSLLLLWKVV